MEHKIIIGDNLEVMRSMESESVDLIATDPPYNTGRDFGDYDDRFGDGFIGWLRERVVEMRRLLKPTGSLYLQCDSNESHYIKVMMDDVMGRKQFRNDISWKRSNVNKAVSKKFSSNKDSILFYTKSSSGSFFELQYKPRNEEYIANSYRLDDNDGKGRYRALPINAPTGSGYKYDYKGFKPPANGWLCPESTMRRYEEEGQLIFPSKPSGRISRKGYLSDYKGALQCDIWDDIGKLESGEDEVTGYQTQKPVALYERIIQASCPEGGLVLDPFAGSGTTIEAAYNLNRSAIGIDINKETPAIARVDKLNQNPKLF